MTFLPLRLKRIPAALAALAALSLTATLAACSSTSQDSQSDTQGGNLVIYSGRSAEYIGTLFDDFTAQTGIQLEVRYGDSAALAAQILEEGDNSPADLFISQDAGSLGALSGSGLLRQLDQEVLKLVGDYYKSPAGDWIAMTGRARILAYAPDRVSSLPNTVDDLLAEKWRGRLGIAPTNASFQSFVTAMIQMRGEVETEKWLRGILANSPKYFEKNSLIVEAIDSGDIDAGLVNHYYIFEVAQELGRSINVKNHSFAPGDVGNLINASGVGILKSSEKAEPARQLIEFLLSDYAQKKFVEEVHEYSVTDPSLKPEGLIALEEIQAPEVELADLAELQRTQGLLIKVGLL